MKTVKSHLTKFVAIALLLIVALPAIAKEATEIRINLRTNLTGITFNSVATKGKVEFENEAAVQRLLFEVNNINVANGSVVSVYVGTARIGSIVLQNQGGTLLRSTAAGQTVPAVAIGTTFKVLYGSTTVLSGAF